MTTVTVEETRVCTNPECIHAGKPQPLDSFPLELQRRAKATVRRHATRCYDCRRAGQREAKRRKLACESVISDKFAHLGPPEGPKLDAKPFVAWLRTLGNDVGEIAEVCGISAAQLQKWLGGHRVRVHLDTVDRALTYADLHTPVTLDDLYPYEEAA